MPQNHEIRFKISKEEHDKIKRNAEKAQMSIKRFILHCTSRVKITIEPIGE